MNITRDINLNTVAEMVFNHEDFHLEGCNYGAGAGEYALPAGYQPGSGSDPVRMLCAYIANLEGVQATQIVHDLHQLWIRFTDTVRDDKPRREQLERTIERTMLTASRTWSAQKMAEAGTVDNKDSPPSRSHSVTELDMAIRGAEATMPTQPIIRRS